MKKLFFLTLLSTQTFCINLQLKKKPSHISVFNWCIQKAKENGNAHEKIIRDKLEKSYGNATGDKLGLENDKTWEEIKNRYVQAYKKEMKKHIANITKSPINQKLKKTAHKLFNHPTVKKIFGVQSITCNTYSIDISTKNRGIIKIISSKQEQETAATILNHIVINPSQIAACSSATIAHELAHIYFNHGFHTFCVSAICQDMPERTNAFYSSKDRARDYVKLEKAREIEADIFSSFADLLEGKKTEILIKKLYIEKMPRVHLDTHPLTTRVDFYNKFAEVIDTHPNFQERIGYISTINNAMENELQSLNQLSPEKIYALGKLELKNNQFAKAYNLLSSVSSQDSQYQSKINLLKTYAQGQINLMQNNLNNAQANFMTCINQNFNNKIKAKSLLDLGILHFNASKNNLPNLVNGVHHLMQAAKQNFCLETQSMASKILKNFFDAHNWAQQYLSLCRQFQATTRNIFK